LERGIAGCYGAPVQDRRPVGWRLYVTIGLTLFLVYSVNGRSIGSGDTVPATMLAAAVARGDGVTLDRYAPKLLTPGALSYWATIRRGHIVSLYPVAPALLAVPFTWLQIRVLDVVWPGWTRFELPMMFLMGKNAAAALAALFGVTLFALLTRLGYGRERWPALVAATLGSEMWVVGSQSLWQHGPSALALGVGILTMTGAPSRKRSFVAGVAAGVVFACRIVSSIYAVPLAAVALVRRPRTLGWFLLGALPLVGATLLYNVYWFESWQGGIVLLEAAKQQTHSVSGRWLADPAGGIAGTLVSPARGLFVYMPWVALSLALLPFHWRRTPHSALVTMLLASLVPSVLVLGAYSTWWGGHSFGPRFWTDATPIFAIVLASALAWAGRRGMVVRGVLYASIAVSVLIQGIGIACYPSSWNAYPANVDHAHERLWSWTDSEITRCVHEGPYPAAYRPLSREGILSALGIASRPPGSAG
jgi:hypothetical protein